MKWVLVKRRASVSSISACPWACEVNSNSYWSDQAGLLPRGQDRPGPARILEAGVIYHVKEELVYMGVDIAKSYLDAAIGNEQRRFANERVGHRELIKNPVGLHQTISASQLEQQHLRELESQRRHLTHLLVME